MVYNFPVVTAGLNLDSDIIGELAQHPNIVGTKLSCGTIGKLHRLTSTVPASKFATFPGVSDVSSGPRVRERRSYRRAPKRRAQGAYGGVPAVQGG